MTETHTSTAIDAVDERATPQPAPIAPSVGTATPVATPSDGSIEAADTSDTPSDGSIEAADTSDTPSDGSIGAADTSGTPSDAGNDTATLRADALHLLFFQNCISPHQMPYIAELTQMPEVASVGVVAPRWSYDDRVAMGWADREQGDAAAVAITIAPTDRQASDLIRQAVAQGGRTVCLFSGITAFPEVAAWLRLSQKFPVERAVVTEPPFTFGRPLWMHRLRFLLRDAWTARTIDYVFAIGAGCADYYRSWSRRWLVVPFMYATSAITPELHRLAAEAMPKTDIERRACRMAFVGAVDRRKNLALVVDALSLMAHRNAAVLKQLRITVVGDGPELEGLRWRSRDAGLDTIVRYVGTRPMDETQRILAAQDYLILPSLHDGWGAVASEALTLGVWPLVSDRCGVRQVVDDGRNGNVFPADDADALEQLLEGAVRRVDSVRQSREERIQWAADHIAPSVVARTMVDALAAK